MSAAFSVAHERENKPKECSVVPPILYAAMPVEAVTATESPKSYFSRSDSIICRRRKDLPVPKVHEGISLDHDSRLSQRRGRTGRAGEEQRHAILDNEIKHLALLCRERAV